MRPIRLLIALLIVFLPAIVLAEDVASPAPNVVLPSQPLTPKILQQFLLAEILLARGRVAESAASYVDLAKTTRDSRIARRAAEIAYYARQPALSLDAAKVWSETEPNSIQAKQTYWALLASLGKLDDLAAELTRMIESESEHRGAVLMQLGRLLARYDDKKVASSVAIKVTEPYLSLPEAHFVRAQSAYSTGDDAAANAELDAALALRPDWEPAAILKAQMLIADPSASIDALAAFIKRNPKARDARLAYARALIDGKRYDEARVEFSALLIEEPDRPDLVYSMGLLSLQSGDLAKAAGYLSSLLNKDFIEMDSAHFYLGQIDEEAGRGEEALKHYEAIAPGTQHHAQAQLRVVAALARSGRTEQALERLRAVKASGSKDRSALMLMEAQLLGDSGRAQDAFQLLMDALQKSPDDAILLYESALYAERLGKYEVLERNLRKAIRLKPDQAHAYNALGYSFADRNINLEEAGILINKALSLAPDDAAILDSKGWLNYRRGDLPGAVDALQKALAVRPDPEISAHLGEVLWQMGRRDEASKTWDEAVKLAPDNAVLNSTIKRFRK